MLLKQDTKPGGTNSQTDRSSKINGGYGNKATLHLCLLRVLSGADPRFRTWFANRVREIVCIEHELYMYSRTFEPTHRKLHPYFSSVIYSRYLIPLKHGWRFARWYCARVAHHYNEYQRVYWQQTQLRTIERDDDLLLRKLLVNLHIRFHFVPKFDPLAFKNIALDLLSETRDSLVRVMHRR